MPRRTSTVDFLRSILVGGPIQHACSPCGFDRALEKTIRDVITVLETAGHRVCSAHRVEEFGCRTHEWTPEEVTVRDHGWIEECDAFVAVLPRTSRDEVYRTDGTHVELGWASALRKPILLVADRPELPPYSHLVRGLAALARVEIQDFSAVASNPLQILHGLDRLATAVSDTWPDWRSNRHPSLRVGAQG